MTHTTTPAAATTAPATKRPVAALPDVWEMQSFDVGLRAGGTIVVYAAATASNGPGIFGNGTTTATANQLVTVPGITTATAVAAYCDDYNAFPAHVCAILGPSGTVSCWGSNHSGEVGVPAGSSVTAPTAVAIPATRGSCRSRRLVTSCARSRAAAPCRWGRA